LRVILVRPLAGHPRPLFVAPDHDEDLGWTAQCPELGITARGSTWWDLLSNCARALDAILQAEGEDGLPSLGYETYGHLTLPGLGTRFDLPFDIRHASGAVPGLTGL